MIATHRPLPIFPSSFLSQEFSEKALVPSTPHLSSKRAFLSKENINCDGGGARGSSSKRMRGGTSAAAVASGGLGKSSSIDQDLSHTKSTPVNTTVAGQGHLPSTSDSLSSKTDPLDLFQGTPPFDAQRVLKLGQNMDLTVPQFIDRENMSINNRLKVPIVRSTPRSLWKVTSDGGDSGNSGNSKLPEFRFQPTVISSFHADDHNKEPREFRRPTLVPIGSERQRRFPLKSATWGTDLDQNTTDSNTNNTPLESKSSFTWSGSNTGSGLGLLTSPLSTPTTTPAPAPAPALTTTTTTTPIRFFPFSERPFELSYHHHHHQTISISIESGSGVLVDNTPVLLPTQFKRLLNDVKRKNPHAPPMPSSLNPIRQRAPVGFWNNVEANPENPKSKRTWNFQKEWHPVLRSRRFCEMSNTRYGSGPLLADSNHCMRCRKDTLYKKLLVFKQWRTREEMVEKQGTPVDVGGIGGAEDEDEDEVTMDVDVSGVLDIAGSLARELGCVIDTDTDTDSDADADLDLDLDSHWDEKVLESPLLRDLDDFEGEEGKIVSHGLLEQRVGVRVV